MSSSQAFEQSTQDQEDHTIACNKMPTNLLHGIGVVFLLDELHSYVQLYSYQTRLYLLIPIDN